MVILRLCPDLQFSSLLTLDLPWSLPPLVRNSLLCAVPYLFQGCLPYDGTNSPCTQQNISVLPTFEVHITTVMCSHDTHSPYEHMLISNLGPG
jgi:hypothetical protein